MLFLLNTIVLLPVEQYVTRELASSRAPHHRVLVLPVLLSTFAAAGVVAWKFEAIFASDPVYLLLTGVLVASLALAARHRGQLAGTRSFTLYGVATIAQTALLLLLGVAEPRAGRRTGVRLCAGRLTLGDAARAGLPRGPLGRRGHGRDADGDPGRTGSDDHGPLRRAVHRRDGVRTDVARGGPGRGASSAAARRRSVSRSSS
jgi:hypothetical protein